MSPDSPQPQVPHAGEIVNPDASVVQGPGVFEHRFGPTAVTGPPEPAPAAAPASIHDLLAQLADAGYTVTPPEPQPEPEPTPSLDQLHGRVRELERIVYGR